MSNVGIPVCAALVHLLREEERHRRLAINHLESAKREIERALADTTFTTFRIGSSAPAMVTHFDMRNSIEADVVRAREAASACNTLRETIHLLRATKELA